MERNLETVQSEELIFEYTPQQKQIQTKNVNLVKEKLINDGKILRVYVDRDSDKYFIDDFAAFAIGLISYEVACSLSDNGNKLYEITKELLEELKQIYNNRIEYQYLPQKKQAYEYSYETTYNDFDGNLYNDFDNKKTNSIDGMIEQFKDNQEIENPYKDTNHKKI